MTNHIALAALGIEIAGALLLARALAFESLATYVAGAQTRYDFNAALDLARASDVADAQVGLALLLFGFAGQALAAGGLGASLDWALVAYPTLLATIGVAQILPPQLRRVRERDILRARLLQHPGEMTHYANVLAAYANDLEDTFRAKRPNEGLRPWAERAFGTALFEGLPRAGEISG